jgi:uncharacterized damage-inducible protein DinB
MITPAFVQIMATYNAEMNRRVYAAASRLGDADRRQERGAFWGSIHATLSHLLWADQTWLARFEGRVVPASSLRDSPRFATTFDDLHQQRAATDAAIGAWAAGLTQAWLNEDLTWFSAAAQRELRKPRALLVSHFFNHQTHHRGQAHALITAAGESTGDTDLFLIV